MNGYQVMTNSAAYALIHRDITEKRVAHAYLIVSPDEKMSDALCAIFLAEFAFGKTDAQSAARALSFGADIIRLPHGDKVLSSDVEELTDTVYYTPTELERKFYVLTKGETMNEASQNKLLKVLEEPPDSVVIIIQCTNANSLLPTVLSRVKRIDVPPLPETEMLDFLRENYGDDSRIYLAAAISQGYIGRAESVMCEKKWVELYNLAVDTLKNMKTSRNILGFSTRIMTYKDSVADFTDILELVLADCTAASCGVRDGLKFKNGIRDIIEISSDYDWNVVVRVMPALRRAKARLEGNGNVQSVLDELLFSLLEVKAKCRR